jgi:hypothetical protein
MENFQFSANDIDQHVFNTAFGGSATSAQLANISDPDTLLDTGSSWFGGGGNDQQSFNTIDQSAFNTSFGGSATSAQVASISDGDTLVDASHDFPVYY